MVIADQAGLAYDEYVEDHEIFTAQVEMNARSIGKVLPGTISAHRFTMRCMKDGIPSPRSTTLSPRSALIGITCGSGSPS